MALKKSELYSSLWSSCDELRGGMDAGQYKDYVLVLLFIKYVSDKYAGVPYAPITIPEGAGFLDMVALKGKPDIGDQVNKKIIAPLANANRLSDLPDFNECMDRESHYVWGKRYLLQVIEDNAAPFVELKHSRMILHIRPEADAFKKRAIVEEWYRGQIKKAVPALIEKWEPLMHVKVERFFVRRMKTRWGNCNPGARTIRLNTDLAKKPCECLEYIVVHEMLHLMEPTHSARFVARMDQFMAKWQFYREQLNRLPVSHEDWVY